MTCTTCHGIGHGKGCRACKNATRAVFGLPPLYQDDGGHEVHGDLSFPIEREYPDEPITTPEAAETWAVVAQVLFIAIVVICACAAFIQIVLPPLYH